MKQLYSLLISFCLIIPSLNAQKVGLVLSGGGAKGVAHIGVIQALEENGIPIDYIAGTSIGAVVGGLYAMGYSPADMLTLIKSKEFSNWMNGKVENEYVDFFRKPDPTPDFLRASISLKDSTFNTSKILPNSLMNPIQMNLAFLQLCTQVTAQCKGDFQQSVCSFQKCSRRC
jgi:Predicted esterase of the alpha-beta hydrolase superfamily